MKSVIIRNKKTGEKFLHIKQVKTGVIADAFVDNLQIICIMDNNERITLLPEKP